MVIVWSSAERHAPQCSARVTASEYCWLELRATLPHLLLFLGHRLGDDLVDWNSGVSVRPSRFPSNLVCG